ncbi:HD-GYP domain-containing protein [Geobacter sp. DSM 9736]|uniref:HD-GYP domain-containing protein n=1 Tax=Geobacter sp. DSM 9736 TaxID=1277350 RepID=UPI000B507ACA|nr:HD domain-containing phosphohydrolase [Geobacter sp. DSM 9736]SNB45138.1 putative two-component system response regulator [Geobacter sp. DSM 9736]
MTAVCILIVDDEPLNRELLATMLSDGAQTLHAADGQEALDVLAANPGVDLILLDLEMPRMDGYETLQVLKKHPVWRDIPVIVITASSNDVKRTLALGANDFLPKPCDVEELQLRVRNHVRSKKLLDLTKDVNVVLEREVAHKTAALQSALDFSRATEYEISLRLGRTAEFRDLETGMHTRRISEMADALGTLAGLPAEECKVLRYAAPLHDVGKVGIPDRILLKPGRLDEQEFEIMKLHTQIGGKILAHAEKYPVLDAGRIIALQHHEKWDGTGYPLGLKGEGIHLYGRIVMVVDVFDALCSARPYKKPFTLEHTIGILKKESGIFFDPALLQLFLDNLEQFVVIRRELEDTMEVQSISPAASGAKWMAGG